MKDFRVNFLSESAEKLQNLCARLETRENLSTAEKSEIFRSLHTIKGTSRAFGFAQASRLAHYLETLLCAGSEETDFPEILLEGIRLLKKSFERENFEFPAKFAEKIKKFAPSENRLKEFERIQTKIPADIFSGLSARERSVLCAELEKGKNLFCAEIGFEISRFSDRLKSFRRVLSDSGEIIATFPSAKFSAGGEIGFRILFASFDNGDIVRRIAKNAGAEIIFRTSPDVFLFDLKGILAQSAAHAQNLAESLGKSVEFVTFIEKTHISEKNLKLIFEILLHLMRNAVDHAFDARGKIEISLKTKKSGLFLTISDDGRGIDLEKVRAGAIDKNLIRPEETLTDEEALRLIFQSELSTAEKVTEISGRGVGLDAVKNAVETAGGEIEVKSKLNKGTTFEIFLPENE